MMEKLQQAFRRLVHTDARRFWATFPGHSCEQGVCHKDSSSSYVRWMSNPIAHITRILLALHYSTWRIWDEPLPPPAQVRGDQPCAGTSGGCGVEK
jgi:hypothetical protein